MSQKETFKNELFQCLEETSELYINHYAYAYNILISYFFEKPIKPLIEIEAAFSHLASAILDFKKGNKEASLQNLKRFKGHIERLLLDLYKLCFLKLHELINRNINNVEQLPDNTLLLLNLECTISCAFKEARKAEIHKIGDDKKEVLEIYKTNLEKVINLYEEIVPKLKE